MRHRHHVNVPDQGNGTKITVGIISFLVVAVGIGWGTWFIRTEPNPEHVKSMFEYHWRKVEREQVSEATTSTVGVVSEWNLGDDAYDVYQEIGRLAKARANAFNEKYKMQAWQVFKDNAREYFSFCRDMRTGGNYNSDLLQAKFEEVVSAALPSK